MISFHTLTCFFRNRAAAATLGLLVTLALLLPGCGDSAGGDNETTLERIERTGTVRLGYANEAPFGYQDMSTGEVTGESPEIAKVILERLGATEVDATLVDWGQLIPGLKAGRYDIVAAGMYITPERAQEVDFSNPTYAIGEGLLVAEGNPHSVHSYTDIKNNDEVQLGVVGGTVEVGIAKEIGVPDSRVTIMPDNATAVQALKSGRIDVFGGTALTVKDLAGKHEGVQPADPVQQPQIEGYRKNYGGFAFRQSDDDLREAFNRELADYIGSEEHLQLIKQFGFDENNLPGDVTTEQIIGGDLNGDDGVDDGVATEDEAEAPDDAASGATTQPAGATTQPASD